VLVINKGLVPVKAWTDRVESGCLEQAINISNLPFVVSHVALMPDTHQGYGMPIGGVAALDGYICPNMVGVDIGCGMIAFRTDIVDITQSQLEEIIRQAKRDIPVGFNHHSKSQYDEWPNGFDLGKSYGIPIISQEIGSAMNQLGTLGGGNHFVEIQRGDDGFIWLMIHSGSRNIGNKVATHYNEIAKEINKAAGYPIPPSYDLACLDINSQEGHEYSIAMHFCLEFAKKNRDLMMKRFYKAFQRVTGSSLITVSVNIHHNYAAGEEHFGKYVIVHRKGATKAEYGQLGIIPGSMGTSSYIVTGLGSEESFNSCSHGSGRVMSRAKCFTTIDVDEAYRSMEGIVFDGFMMNGKGKRKGLDEAPQAYKDIEDVMANQADLVRPFVKLKPLAVMKG